jgi:hypothetical protein
MAVGDVSKINHEPMWAIFGGANLGLIAPGSVTVNFTDEWVDQMAHQTGNLVLESYYKPGSPTIHIKAIEILTMANWAVAFPTGSAQGDGGSGSRFSPTLITAGTSTPYAGQKASTVDAQLTLRPAAQYADASTEKTRDLWFPSAWCRSVGEMQFDIEQPMAFDLTFGTLFVAGASEGEHLWIWGLKTGAWVDA